MDTRTIKRAFFTLDGQHAFSGYYRPADVRDGYCLPLFSFAQAWSVIEHVTGLNGADIYNPDADEFFARLEPGKQEIFKAHHSRIEGMRTRVYAIGGYSWEWRLFEGSRSEHIKNNPTDLHG